MMFSVEFILSFIAIDLLDYNGFQDYNEKKTRKK